MRLLLVPLVGYVLLYAPGHFVLRRAEPVAGEASRLLREVLLSACCTSWIGFLLAELGYFSLPLLLALVGGVALVGYALPRGSAPSAYGKRDVIGLAVWIFACAWMAPPLDTRFSAADSSGYLAGGMQLARHGTLVMHDPTLARLSVDLKRALFPSVAPERGVPPYLRLSGSFILRSLDSDEVLPAFHHLITVWIAAADTVLGFEAGEWVITIFGGLSIWAIVECAALLGASTLLVLPLLLLSAIQYWYSRFLMPEVMGQFFVWAGLACIASHERTACTEDAVLAGVAFGIAGLTRTENAVFLLVALAIVYTGAPRSSRRQYALLLAAAGVAWLHAAIHLSVFRTHYFGILRQFLLSGLPVSVSRYAWIGSIVVAVAAALAAYRWRRAGWARWSPVLDYSLLGGMLLVAFWGGYRSNWSSLRLLVSCTGAPTLLGGGIGLLLLLRDGAPTARAGRLLVWLAALVFMQVMLAPHAQPVPIWTARRALTIVFPAVCVGLAVLCRTLGRRWHWMAAVVLLCSGLLGEGRLFWQLRTDLTVYRGARRHVQAIAALLPPGACLLFDGQLVALGLAQSLWGQSEVPAYFFSTGDAERITELATSLDGVPLYWVSNGMQPLPRAPGLELVPAALYEFVIETPKLDGGSPLGSTVNWQMAIALYRLHITPHGS